MRFIDSSTLVKGTVLTAIALPSVLATEVDISSGLSRRHAHSHQKKHTHQNGEKKVAKRGGACSFPGKGKMVAVAKGKMNGGWALPPDQPCQPGMYCPYACPPGYLMGQWDPKATSYTYPQSMNGGLLCGMDGEVSIPFPEKEFCYEGAGTFLAKNQLSEAVAICQTVLPGREDMLIPTLVPAGGTAILAVPGTEYWCQTAAHYYINPPGVSVEEGCIWGSLNKPHGNWTPYVAGANVDANGNTFTKIGWNPIYLEPATPFRDERPDFGVKIICAEGGNCNGLPCIIDPSVDAVNSVNGVMGSGDGAGGANFCVVTAPKGSKAILVTFPAGKADDDSAGTVVGELSISSSETETETETTEHYEPTSTSTSSTSTSTTTSTTSTSTSTSTTSTTTSTSTSTSSSTSSSTSTSCESTSTSTSTTSSSVHYRNTTSSAYTPTLTPVNQGVSNNTVEASLYTEPASSTVALPSPSATEPQGAASAMLPSISTIFTLSMAAVAYAVIGF